MEPLQDEALRQARLDSMKRRATALLAVAAIVFIITRLLEPHYPWIGIVRATAEASMVGGLADWFAVTALFRHPLGIPIPHTAIIPQQKERLGAALGRFVATHLFTESEVAGVLGRLDLPGILHRFLADPAASRPAAVALAAMLPRVLAT